jgi:hypothetical protein
METLEPNLIRIITGYLKWPELVELGGSSKLFMHLMSSLIEDLMYERRNEITENARKFMLRTIKQHFIVEQDNAYLFRGWVPNYMALRWLLYDGFPKVSLRTTMIRRNFNMVFKKPLYRRGFWNRGNTRALQDLVRDEESYRSYMKQRMARKSGKLSRYFGAWYQNKYMTRALKNLLKPSCGICYARVRNTDIKYACSGCRVTIPNRRNHPHNPLAVLVCGRCYLLIERDEHEEDPVHWHCPIKNPGCTSYCHTGQGCDCHCHDSENEMNKMIEYAH